jgi:Flp pilus assembly pilin Flp
LLQVLQLRRYAASLQSDAGQTLVEYSLILALITLIGLGGVVVMVGGINGLYEIVAQAYDAMCNAVGDCPSP